MILRGIAVFYVLVSVFVSADKVADILFKTNLQELHDVPIVFDKPVPHWLKGTMIRNGAGRFEVGDRKFTNALDAYGKLASWRFPGNGSAYFSTKMIYSKSYTESVAINDIAPYMVFDKTDPSFDLVQELESFKNGPDNMNVNIFNFGGDKLDFVVLSDYWQLYTIDPRSLATLKGVHPLIPNTTLSMTSIVLSSAHPLPEYGTKNMLTFVSVASAIPGEKSKLILVRVTSAEDRELIASIEVDKASYMHSFAVTENYAIIIAVPFYVNPLGMFKDFRPLDAFEWVSTDITKLYVVNLKTGDVKTLKTENMFFFHVVNAYESDIFGDEIIIDICTFKDIGGLHQMGMDHLHDPIRRANSSIPLLKRYQFNIKTGDVNVHTFDSTVPYAGAIDFPTINEHYRSKRYCYTYAIAYNYNHHDFLDMALVKKDVCSGKNDLSYTHAGKYLNEAYFIPTPDGKEEDDGILVLPVLDMNTQTTNFTIFNATDLSILSSAKLPTNIPFGTHGHFFDYLF